MPNDIEIRVKGNADTADAEAKLARLRKAIAGLSGKTVKVDVEVDSSAAAELGRVEQAAERIDGDTATVEVDADTGAADAELAVTDAEVSRLDGRTAHVNVDADIGSALAKIAIVGAALAALGAAAGGIGAAVGLGAVAGAGIGAAVAGLSGIGGAVKALGEQTKGAGAAAGQAAGRELQMASAVDRVRMAQAQLANTREQVADTTRRAGQAAARAADQEREAARRVTEAQKDLTRARADAARQLQDLARQQEDMALRARGALLDIEQAKTSLDETLADPRATDLQRRQAQLAYDEAVKANADLKRDAQDLAARKAEADRRGVAGSEQVADATARVVEAQRNARDAHIATAEAADQAESAQRDGALRLVQAQQQVVEAQRAVQAASIAAGSAGAAGVDKLGQAMKGLTPTGQAFARFLRAFIDGPIQQLRNAGQEGLLPGMQAGLATLGPVIQANLPAFRQFATVVGQALGGIIEVAGKLAPPLMRMATTVLQALAPMQGVLTQFAVAFGQVIDRVTADGSMQTAIGAFIDLFAALLLAIPPLIPPMVQLATSVLPVLTKAVELLTGWLTSLLSWMGDKAPGAISTLGGWLTGLARVITGRVVPAVQVMAEWLRERVLPPLMDLGRFIADHVLPAAVALAKGIGGGLLTAFREVGGTIAAHREELSTLAQFLLTVTGLVLKLAPAVGVVLGLAFRVLGVQVRVFITVLSALVSWFQFGITWAGRVAVGVRVAFDRIVGFARALPARIRSAVVGLFAGITERATAAGSWVAARLGGIVTFVRGLPGKIANAAVGLMSGVKEEIGQAVRWITDKIQTVIEFIKSIPGHVGRALVSVAKATAPYAPGGGLLSLFGHASGGITGAAGGGPRSGWTMVGEQGRELVRLPAGSTVHSAPDTERMMSGSGGGAQVLLQVMPGGSALDRMFVEWLREAVRKGGGGSVQAYLGS